MQIIEKEIGRAVSPYFGELVCMADTEEAVKNAVKIVRIEILKKRYHIVFILDGEEWALSKNTKTDTWSLMPAAEARPVEMDYSK